MPYDIKQYSRDQAKKLNVVVRPSSKGNFKIDVFKKDGKYITSIGDKRYSDFPTYIQSNGIEYANKRRELYQVRHSKDSGESGYYAKRILW
jgi:hypothetical protein